MSEVLTDEPIPYALPEPSRCLCSHLLMLHKINGQGERANCSSSACGCRTFRDATCIRCTKKPSVGPCCSSHNVALCHGCYRRTHFVEICTQGCPSCLAEGLDPMKAVA